MDGREVGACYRGAWVEVCCFDCPDAGSGADVEDLEGGGGLGVDGCEVEVLGEG